MPGRGFLMPLGATDPELWVPGLSDWSNEVWIHGRYDTELMAGAAAGYSAVVFTHDSNLIAPPITAGVGYMAGFPAFSGFGISWGPLIGAPPVPGATGALEHAPFDTCRRWMYFYAEYDRDGFARLYYNGEMVVEYDISGDVALAVSHYYACPPVSSWVAIGGGGGYLSSWVGPMAMHPRLLTAAEIKASFEQGTVRAFANSIYAFDPMRAKVFEPTYDVDNARDEEADAYLGDALAGEQSEVSYKSDERDRTIVFTAPAVEIGETYYYSSVLPPLHPDLNPMVLAVRHGLGYHSAERWSAGVDTRKVTV